MWVICAEIAAFGSNPAAMLRRVRGIHSAVPVRSKPSHRPGR